MFPNSVAWIIMADIKSNKIDFQHNNKFILFHLTLYVSE